MFASSRSATSLRQRRRLGQELPEGVGVLGQDGQGDVEVLGAARGTSARDVGELVGQRGEVLEELLRCSAFRFALTSSRAALFTSERLIVDPGRRPQRQGVDDRDELVGVDGLEDRIGLAQHLLELEPARRASAVPSALWIEPGGSSTPGSKYVGTTSPSAKYGPFASSAPGSMSTNFSPNSVFGRTVNAASPRGCRWPSLMSIVTSARPSTSSIDWTWPMLTPRIFTSEPASRPWPADVEGGLQLVAAVEGAEGALDPDGGHAGHQHDGAEARDDVAAAGGEAHEISP